MGCDAKESYVNDYMKQLRQEPVETDSKGNKQTHRQGQETNSEGSSFYWGFFKQNKKLEAYPYKNTTNPTARHKLFSQNDYYGCWKIKEATSLEGSNKPCHYTPYHISPHACMFSVQWQKTLLSLLAHDPSWDTSLTAATPKCAPCNWSSHGLGFGGFFSGIKKAIHHLLLYCHPGDLSLDCHGLALGLTSRLLQHPSELEAWWFMLSYLPPHPPLFFLSLKLN